MRRIAVDETELEVKVTDTIVCIWSAVDVDPGELIALDVSYGRSSPNLFAMHYHAMRNGGG